MWTKCCETRRKCVFAVFTLLYVIRVVCRFPIKLRALFWDELDGDEALEALLHLLRVAEGVVAEDEIEACPGPGWIVFLAVFGEFLACSQCRGCFQEVLATVSRVCFFRES